MRRPPMPRCSRARLRARFAAVLSGAWLAASHPASAQTSASPGAEPYTRPATPFGANASSEGASSLASPLPSAPAPVIAAPGASAPLPVIPAAPAATATGETAAVMPANAAVASNDSVLQPPTEVTLPEPGQPQPASETALEKILAQAALDSPAMLEQEQRVAQSDAARFRSWVRYLPTLAATYNLGIFYQANNTGTGRSTAPGGAFTVQADRPLFDWGASAATAELALLRHEIARSDALLAYTRLCLDLRSRYNTLVVTKARTALFAQRAQSAARVRERDQILADTGRGTQSRLAQAGVQAELLALEQARAAGELKFQLDEFRRLAGAQSFTVDDIPDYIVIPSINPKGLDEQLKGFASAGYQTSPAARDAALRQQAIDRQLVINNARTKPSFNLSAGVTQSPYDGSNNSGLQFTTFLFAGVSGSWNIFDKFETRDARLSLLAQRRLANLQAANSREELLNSAADSLGRLDLALRAQSLLKRQLALRQDNYRELQIRAASGRTEQTEADALRDEISALRWELLQQQAEAANCYHAFLTALFRDPSLAHAPQFARATPANP